MEGIHSYDNAILLLQAVQKSVLFKFFDLVVSIVKPEELKEVAMFMVDKNIQVKEISSLLKSLFYEMSLKEYVENDCKDYLQTSLQSFLKEKKKGKAKHRLCACCNMPPDFDTMITNRCSHSVSIFCAAGVAKCPMTYACPKCVDSLKKKSKLGSSRPLTGEDLVLD